MPHPHLQHRASVPANAAEKRGLIIVIILCFLATVGMFCLIIALVIWKNKRDRRKREAKMDREKGVPRVRRRRGRYQRLEDEFEGSEEGEGVWSVEMMEVGRGEGREDCGGREVYEQVRRHSVNDGADHGGVKDFYQ